jgi:hypothetical protein
VAVPSAVHGASHDDHDGASHDHDDHDQHDDDYDGIAQRGLPRRRREPPRLGFSPAWTRVPGKNDSGDSVLLAGRRAERSARQDIES